MMVCSLFVGCNEKGEATTVAVQSFDVKEPEVYMTLGEEHTIEIINIEPEFAVLDRQYLILDDNYESGIVAINQAKMMFKAIGVGRTVVDIYYNNGQEIITSDIRVSVSDFGLDPAPDPQPEVSIHKVWLADYSTPSNKYYILFDLTDPAKAMVGETGDFMPDLTEGQFLKYSNAPIPYTVSENEEGTSGRISFQDGEINIRYDYHDLTATSMVLEQLNAETDTPVTATLYTDEIDWSSPE